MILGFSVFRRNPGHWDITSKEHGRLFRLRGGPGQWDVIDERRGKGQNSAMLRFREQSAAMAYICAELMHELLTVEGQEPHVMESWNIGWTDQHDAMGPSYATATTSGDRNLFGLVAQGHIPAVEAALAEGADWQEIGRRIGWDGDTAKAYYERHVANEPRGYAE